MFGTSKNDVFFIVLFEANPANAGNVKKHGEQSKKRKEKNS